MCSRALSQKAYLPSSFQDPGDQDATEDKNILCGQMLLHLLYFTVITNKNTKQKTDRK
jgi:hypothetical protein